MQWIRRQLSHVWSRVRQWRCRVNEESSNKRIAELDESVERLGVPIVALPRTYTREALHENRDTLETFPYGSLLIAAFLMTVIAKTAPDSVGALQDAAETHALNAPARVASNLLIGWGMGDRAPSRHEAGSAFPGILLFSLWALPVIWLGSRRLGRGAERRYRLTLRTSAAVKLCADAYESTRAERPWALTRLDSACRLVERNILKARHNAGTMPRRSSRHAHARIHAAYVAGALRQQMDRLDEEPEIALRDLGVLLVTIGERHAEGRVSAMLPESSLSGVAPLSLARSTVRESLHVVAVIVGALAGAIIGNALTSATAIPADLRPWMVAAFAILGAIICGGWHRVARLLELFPGK